MPVVSPCDISAAPLLLNQLLKCSQDETPALVSACEAQYSQFFGFITFLYSLFGSLLSCALLVQGLAGIVGNPVLSQAIAGLATSATAQATLERVMLFDLKDKIIEPFGETAQQVFARISAMRDSLDGPQVCLLPGAAALLAAV